MTTIFRPSRWFSAVVLAVLIAGCASDPRFREQNSVREARINRVLTDWHVREAEGERRIANTLDFGRRAREQHVYRLDRDLQRVGDEFREREERWPERWQDAQDWFGDQFAGDPDGIDRVIPYLFY